MNLYLPQTRSDDALPVKDNGGERSIIRTTRRCRSTARIRKTIYDRKLYITFICC